MLIKIQIVGIKAHIQFVAAEGPLLSGTVYVKEAFLPNKDI